MNLDVLDVVARLADGGALTDAESHEIVGSRDLIALGMLSEAVRDHRFGRRVTFVRVIEMPLDSETPKASVLPVVGAWRLVGETDDVDRLLRFTEAVARAAAGTPVSGFSLGTLETLSRHTGSSLADLLVALRDSGLERLADAPIDALADPRGSFEAARTAGLPVERVTVNDLVEDWPALIDRFMELHRDGGQIPRFAPLPRHVEAQGATGYDDVRQVALARLLVPGVDSIQVDWTLHGPKLAQVALTFGADDIDAVVPSDTSAMSRRRMPHAELRRNIEVAALEPIERNGRAELMS